MLITGIKSRPVYDRLRVLHGGKLHILAGQGSGGQALLRLLDEMHGQRGQTVLMYSEESFSGQNFLAALREQAVGELCIYASNQALVADLGRRLEEARMGTRLYLSGSESFIGTAMQAATRCNMDS